MIRKEKIMKNNKTCIICNKEYHYCNNCNKGRVNKPWMELFDTENCSNIFDMCIRYRDNIITSKEAYEQIKTFDLSDIDNFAENVRNTIGLIIKENEDKKIEKIEETKEAEKETIKEKVTEKFPAKEVKSTVGKTVNTEKTKVENKANDIDLQKTEVSTSKTQTSANTKKKYYKK